jgi:hypothetical protein
MYIKHAMVVLLIIYCDPIHELNKSWPILIKLNESWPNVTQWFRTPEEPNIENSNSERCDIAGLSDSSTVSFLSSFLPSIGRQARSFRCDENTDDHREGHLRRAFNAIPDDGPPVKQRRWIQRVLYSIMLEIGNCGDFLAYHPLAGRPSNLGPQPATSQMLKAAKR